MYLVKDYLQELSTGVQVVANQVAEAVHSAGVWTKYYDIPMDIVPSDYATIFLLFCICLLSCLICIFTIKIQSYVMGFALTFPFIECGLYFGLVPNYVAFFMVVCYWIALLSMALSGYKKTTKNKSAGFVRIGNSFYTKSNSRFQISEKIGIYSIVMCVACALISGMVVNLSNYERSTKIDDIRNSVKDSVENFSLENAPYIISRLGSILGSGNNGTFNGTLGQRDNVEYDNVEKLSITTDDTPKTDLYLKCYIGSKYTGQSWDRFEEKTFKNQMFDTFKENKFYPQDLNYSQVDSNLYDTYNLTISPVKKNLRTTYIPYFSQIQNDYSYINDTLIRSQDKEKYSFKVLNIPKDDIYRNALLEPSSNLMIIGIDSIPFDSIQYSRFVNENYLTIEDTESMEKIKEVFSAYLRKFNLDFDEFKSTASTYYKLTYIRDFLCYNYDYTLSPGKTPIGEDYVEHFLTQMDKGFCSHFASAGTLLCRMLDIPSRYAEGYYISVDHFNDDTLNDGIYTISVEDNMAHAWTEIYVDRLGWISYDFTPGFNNNPTRADLMNNPNMPNDIQQNQEPIETVQPTQTSKVDTNDQPSEMTTTPNPQDNPEVTTTPSMEDLPQENPTDNKILKVIKNIIVFILIIALIVGGTIFRRKYILKVRNDNISSSNDKVSVLSSYKYILSLLDFIGYTREKDTQHLDFARKVSSKVKYARDFPKVMEVVLKVDLSNDNVTENEKILMSNFVDKLSNTIYERQNRIGKFIMKYIMCLI